MKELCFVHIQAEEYKTIDWQVHDCADSCFIKTKLIIKYMKHKSHFEKETIATIVYAMQPLREWMNADFQHS